MINDQLYMKIAYSILQRSVGSSFPNPTVVSLIVESNKEYTNNEIRSYGITEKGGRPHAEKIAIDNLKFRSNKNGVPFDPESPFVTSGIRLGSPAGTSRGFGSEQFRLVGNLIGDVLDGLSENPDDNSKVENEVKAKVKSLCDKFPIYSSAI